ncbi:conserved hypothetical protein [Carnobacterium divergens]|nr:conserved hypothetical protein [Carnobacterium divergens]SPC40442.1 conserved hypothetical protein [Carnobacterium divergens]
MDILITLLILILFFLLIVKKITNFKIIGLWAIICLLCVVLYFLHATNALNISL